MLTTKKAQVVLAADQYDLLEARAREEGTTVSALIREHLERTLLTTLHQRRREAAFSRLTGMNLPTADWDVMERQIDAMWEGHETE